MRLAGTAKLGFYPTPQRIVDHITARLSPTTPDQTTTILDPCAGEGLALRDVANASPNAISYAIEPDRYRYNELKSSFATPLNALNCTMEDSAISHQSFSILYLNPPYDYHYDRELEDNPNNNKTIRKEIHFLRRTIQYLATDGLLIFIVPRHILSPNLAEFLSARFNNLDAYTFPEPELEMFDQIVITGNKKPKTEPQPATLELHDFDHTTAPTLNFPTTSAVKLFKTYKPNPEELAELITPKLNELHKPITHTPKRNIDTTPPLPLHLGHLSLLLAAGKINGILGDGPDRHVVRGSVIKTISTAESSHATENGTCNQTTHRDNYTVTIKTLELDGTITTLV
jgi:tRNA1(Val) A37 N6-methylase TrmN6